MSEAKAKAPLPGIKKAARKDPGGLTIKKVQVRMLEFETDAEFEEPVIIDIPGFATQAGICKINPAGTAVNFEARGHAVAQAGEDLRGEYPIAVGIAIMGCLA